MALFKKGIYEIEKKLLLLEKLIHSQFNDKFKWTYKQTMGFLFCRQLKILKSNEFNENYTDIQIFFTPESICYKLQITEITLNEWVRKNENIAIIKNNTSIIKVDLITLHTFIQSCYSHNKKYSDNYIIEEIEFLKKKYSK
jgi:hypothetical protein